MSSNPKNEYAIIINKKKQQKKNEFGSVGSFGRVFDSGSKGHEFETHHRHCVVSVSKTLYPLLSTPVQPRKTPPDMTEELFTGA